MGKANISNPLLIGLSVVLALAGILVLLTGGKHTESDPARTAPRPSPTASARPTPAPSSAASSATPAPHGLDPDLEQVAGDVVRAYTQYSWRDAGPGDWVSRTSRYATPALTRQLHASFDTAQSQAAWGQDVVDFRRETRTAIRAVESSVLHPRAGSQVTVAVTYTTAVRTQAMSSWSEPTEKLSKFVTLQPAPSSAQGVRGWVVVSIVDTADRSGGDQARNS